MTASECAASPVTTSTATSARFSTKTRISRRARDTHRSYEGRAQQRLPEGTSTRSGGRLGGPLDGGQGDRDAAAGGLGALGGRVLGVAPVPVVEPGDAAGQELPRLGDLRAAVHRGERVAPPDPDAADHPGELTAAIRRHDLRTRLPGPSGQLVAAGEPGPGPGAVA